MGPGKNSTEISVPHQNKGQPSQDRHRVGGNGQQCTYAAQIANLAKRNFTEGIFASKGLDSLDSYLYLGLHATLNCPYPIVKFLRVDAELLAQPKIVHGLQQRYRSKQQIGTPKQDTAARHQMLRVPPPANHGASTPTRSLRCNPSMVCVQEHRRKSDSLQPN